MAKFSFKRVEKKYIVTKSQRDELLKELLLYMEYDKYCVGEKTYKIQNIYYDTPDNVLISKSIQKPVYKEKLRARKYVGTKNCFLEIKKKEGVAVVVRPNYEQVIAGMRDNQVKIWNDLLFDPVSYHQIKTKMEALLVKQEAKGNDKSKRRTCTTHSPELKS